MILLGKLGIGLLSGVVVAGGVASSEGFLHVRVEQKRTDGTHLRLVLPAILVPAALSCVPGRHLREAARDVRPWIPAIAAAASGLLDTPDGPLVEVTTPGEQVSVRKSGASLVVDVEDPEETVHVSAPLRAVRSAARVLGDRAGPL